MSVSVLLFNKVKLRDLVLFFQHFPDGYLPEHIRASLECWRTVKKFFQYGCLHTISTVSSAGEVIEVKDTEQTHFRRSNSSLLLSGYGGSLMCHKASTVFQGNQRIPLGVEKKSC